ncbi:MAG: hypothetical protein DSY83_05245 [Flavobacteriia bacterium]|nr:MAG: hypothetical protein DSY83_05245 [Flavobacteriia bacterium]
MPIGQKCTWKGIRAKKFGDKLDRLKLAAPKFHKNKVFFSKELENNIDMDTYLTELKMTTKSEIKSTDNGLDSTSIILSEIGEIYYPPKPIEAKTLYNDTITEISPYGSVIFESNTNDNYFN